MNFTLSMPVKVVFGRGELKNTGKYVAGLGSKFLVVTAPPLVESGVVKRLTESLEAAGLSLVVYAGVTGEPSPANVHEAAALAIQEQCDALIGIGGGSAMDTAKAAAGIAANGGPVVEYLESVGIGRTMTKQPLPFVAVPTTSGTGAEATKNAVIADVSAGFKFSFRDERLLARVALLDPELTVSAPKTVTAWSGMDAMTQLIESYISKKSQPVTDALALSGLKAAAPALPRAYADGTDIDAREGMAYGSFLSGVCLANAGLGADHAIAAAFGAVEGIPHGLACAVLLPYVVEINMPHVPAVKAAALSEALTGKAWADRADNAKAVVGHIRAVSQTLGIPAGFALKDMTTERLERIFKRVSGSSMGGNPVELSKDDVMELIKKVTG